MLSRRWPKPKGIKHVTAQVGSVYPSSWNVTLYLQFKRPFSFFTQSATFPIKVFWSRFNPNTTIKWSMKVQKSVGSKISKEEHGPWHLQHTTSHKLIWNFLLRPFDGNHLTWESPPHYIPSFQRRCFSFPININIGWLCKSVTHF